MSRPLTAIPAGTTVMVDAKIFVYALIPLAQHHESSLSLLERGAVGDIRLVATVVIAADVIHRAMVLEVLGRGLARRSGEAVALLKHQPQSVAQLTHHRTILRELREARVDILPLTYRDLHASRVYREQYGLLVNDSLLVAVMHRENIQSLATNDQDFERIPGVSVRTPSA